MRYCPSCGHPNPQDINICLGCAVELGQHCPTCGQPVTPGSRFCSHCGTRLTDEPATASSPAEQDDLLPAFPALKPAPGTPEVVPSGTELLGERREVTVLILDVSNFTTNFFQVDSEEVYVLIDEALRALADLVHKYEGTIDKFTGDGLMALFGAPVAHENDPERAVRASIEMHHVLQPFKERVKQQYGFDFQIRIGIDTGQVVAGNVGGNTEAAYTVMGNTANLAARLEAAAQPGTTLVGFSTYQRTATIIKYEALPPVTLKGVPHPVPVYRPIGLRERPGPVRGLPGLQVPMIGRQDALIQMRGSLESVHQEQTRIVLITGEAGVGKSRLVAEFLNGQQDQEINIYSASCLAYARSRPLYIVAELLSDIMHLSELDSPEVQARKVLGYLSQIGLANEQTVPYLYHLLGLPQESPEMEARLALLDAVMLQRQTHTALRKVILAECRLAPTILFFDDLHWVDPASRDLLEYLIQTITNVPLMLILVSRDAERKTVIQSLVARAEENSAQLLDIQLEALSEREGQQLVDEILPQASPEATALKQRIARRAEGNPFYTEEIVRILMDQGGLVHHDGVWEVTPQAEELLQEVPGTLKGLILARFDRLGEELRRTLQKIAVLGTSFPVNLLQQFSRLEGKALEVQLEELEGRDFLVTEPFGDEKGYAFRHALIQEAIYSTLLKRDLQRLHEQAAAVIEQSSFWSPEEQTEVLAYHYARSAEPTKAVPFLVTAAENAARRYANETTIYHYRQALTIMSSQPDNFHEEFAQVRLGLGEAYKFVGQFAEAREVLERALKYLRLLPSGVSNRLSMLVDALGELADVEQREGVYDEAIAHLEEGLALLGEDGVRQHPRLWRSLMDRMAFVLFREGKVEEAQELALAAIGAGMPGEADDPITLASLYNTLGGLAWQRGELAEASRYVERSISLYESLGYFWGMAIAYTNLGVLSYAQGLWAKAAENFERVDVIRRQNGYIAGQAINLKNLGLLRIAMGDHVQARKDMETSLTISQRLGDDFGIACAELGLAVLTLAQGKIEEAANHVQAAMQLIDSAGMNEKVQALCYWALIQAERGELMAGLETAREALELVQDAGLPESEPDCYRVLGVLLGRAGEISEAEARLKQSITLCQEQEDPYRAGQGLFELGSLYRRLAGSGGNVKREWGQKAEEALFEAIHHFQALGAAFDLRQAQEALFELQAMLAPALPEGEWYSAVVIWIDLSLPSEADVEARFEAVALVTPAISKIAGTYGGQLLPQQEGLIILFGVPTTHEDDGARAVQAAWEIAQMLEARFSDGALRLTARIAISKGPLVSRGDQRRQEFVMQGEPVQVAQPLAQVAPAGKVWVTQKVRSAAEHLFLFRSVSAGYQAMLEGLALSEVVAVREVPHSPRGLPGKRSRLIGREGTLARMQEVAARLDRGSGGIIWIEGDAGIGKSRLMEEFASLIQEGEALAWFGLCSQQRSTRAFSLFSDLFAHMVGLRGTDDASQIVTRVQRTLAAWPREVREARPYLELLLGVRPGGPEGERLATLEPDQLRQQTFVGIRSLLKNLAASRPLVLFLDDLHWIDSMSADLLLFLSHLINSAPILFVCARRPEQQSGATAGRLHIIESLHPEQSEKLVLNRLTDEQSHALLNEILPGIELPSSFQEFILRRCGGNPYYIEEFIRLLVEQGHLIQQPDRWELSGDLSTVELVVPDSLEALIRSRVDALPAELKQVVQWAAVIGRPFECALLRAIISHMEVESALAQLEARRMLQRSAEGDEWLFNHPLIETVVYHTLLKARRQALHLRVARALETHWGEAAADHAEELAYHFTQAEEAGRALTYLVLAGERAAARYANEEALGYFQQATTWLSRQPTINDDIRWRLATGLGDVYRLVGRYAESREVLAGALTLTEEGRLAASQRAGLYRRLGETLQKQGDLNAAHDYFTTAFKALGAPAGRLLLSEAARTLNALGWNHFLRGQVDQALEACQRSVSYAQEAGTLSELATAENSLGGIYYFQGNWELASHHTMQAMALREQMGYSWGVAASYSNLGILAFSTGDWPKASDYFQRSLTLRQELGDVEGLVISHNNIASLYRDQGKLAQAEHHFEQSLAIATPLKMFYHMATATLGLTQVMLFRQEVDGAREMVASSLSHAEAIGAQDLLSECYRIKAEVLLAQEAPEQAVEMARKSATLAAETGNRMLESAAWRVVCASELERQKLQAARDAIDRAWQALADVTDELEQGRVAAQMGLLNLAAGDSVEAERHLQAAQRLFARLGAQSDLARIERALHQLPRSA